LPFNSTEIAARLAVRKALNEQITAVDPKRRNAINVKADMA